MKASEFRTLLGSAAGLADQLSHMDGIASADMARTIELLEATLAVLAPYTRPGGGGMLEMDIPAYQGEDRGGTPAFMRDVALDLLNVATVLERAREAYWALEAPDDPAADKDKPAPASEAAAQRARPELRFPREARTNYTAEEMQKVQKLFRFLYSKRAYARVKQGGIWRRALRAGRLGGDCKDIVTLSRTNLLALRRQLKPMSRAEQDLYVALFTLPFRLKHTTASQHRAAIANVGMLWSLQRLQDWFVLPSSQFTTASDKYQKADDDFVFFRMEVGEDAVDTRYGDLQFVFKASQVFADGWVTLHDMLAPIDSQTLQTLRLKFAPDTVVRRSRYLDDKHWWHTEWEHAPCDPAAPDTPARRVHILDEVFYGPDIREGLVRAILRDLREVPTLQQEAFEHCGDVAYLRWLLSVLYRLEAKYPSSFRFSAETLVREHHKPAAQVPALKAAV
ncbi:hypothetical protein [Thauera sp. WH-1]|uniref:hypothetical protein n=1 Tax=Thauera sp. WH-1 TaxID=3398230 RepID=UPI0039FBE335